MNREQKAAVIEQIAAEIRDSNAVFAVDYRGITVGQVAELRDRLRESGASFRVVKNSLTQRAAEQIGADDLKPLLVGPTALTLVRGDVALAAKAVADQARATQLLPFKGGIMGGDPLTPEQVGSIARLPARDVLYGQLAGLVASPIGGLVRTLNALVSGIAIQLGGVLEQKRAASPVAEPPAPASSDTEPAQDADSGTDAPAPSRSPSGDGSGATEPTPDAAEAAAETAAEGPAVAEAESGTEAESGAPAAQAVPAEAKASPPAPEPAPVDAAGPPAEQALAEDAAAVAAKQEQADPEPGAPAETDNQTDASADPVEAKEDQ
ncbi:MAG: 50S ribosomal protein L10 [Solirubrobacteraceae bacterium]